MLLKLVEGADQQCTRQSILKAFRVIEPANVKVPAQLCVRALVFLPCAVAAASVYRVVNTALVVG